MFFLHVIFLLCHYSTEMSQKDKNVRTSKYPLMLSVLSKLPPQATSSKLKFCGWTLKQALHKKMPKNLNELKQCWKEQATNPPQRGERLIKLYRKGLLQVIACKGGSKSY